MKETETSCIANYDVNEVRQVFSGAIPGTRSSSHICKYELDITIKYGIDRM